MALHSFAVLAYKDSPFLFECLDSLKAQTIGSDIYIVTSTPSQYITDSAKKYGIEVFSTSANQGISHDWNFGLNQARTKYVTLAHQDDLYLPKYAEECILNAEKFSNTLICFSDYIEIFEGQERSNTNLLKIKRLMLSGFMPFKKNAGSKFGKKILLSLGCPIAAPSVMFNLENLKGFQFSNNFSINMDWDAWTRMSDMEGRFVYVKKILLKHRIHSDSATTSGLKNNFRQEEDLKMFRRFWPLFIAKQIARFYKGSYKSNG